MSLKDHIIENTVPSYEPAVNHQNGLGDFSINLFDAKIKTADATTKIYTVDLYEHGEITKIDVPAIAEYSSDSFVVGQPVLIQFSDQFIAIIKHIVQGQFFAVRVEKDGGDNGDGSSPASYTYKVADLNWNVLGEGVSVTRPRPDGEVVYQTGTIAEKTAGFGSAFYNQTTLILWDAGEIPDTEECEDE